MIIYKLFVNVKMSSNIKDKDSNKPKSLLLDKTREFVQFASTVGVQGERIKNFNSLLKRVCKMGDNKKNKRIRIEREIAELFHEYYKKYYDEIDEFDFEFLKTIKPLIYGNSQISYPISIVYKAASKEQHNSDKFEDLFIACIFHSLMVLHKNKDDYENKNSKYVVTKEELDNFIQLVSELNESMQNSEGGISKLFRLMEKVVKDKNMNLDTLQNGSFTDILDKLIEILQELKKNESAIKEIQGSLSKMSGKDVKKIMKRIPKFMDK